MRFGITNAIPAGSALTLASGAVLDLNGYNLAKNSNTVLNGGTIKGAGSTFYAGADAANAIPITATGTSAITTTTLNLQNNGGGNEKWIIATNDGDVLTITSNITGTLYDTHFGGNGTIILTGTGTWTERP